MRIDSIKNGIVIDHIAAGKAKEVYDALDLGKLDCQVAIIMNCRSNTSKSTSKSLSILMI